MKVTHVDRVTTSLRRQDAPRVCTEVGAAVAAGGWARRVPDPFEAPFVPNEGFTTDPSDPCQVCGIAIG